MIFAASELPFSIIIGNGGAHSMYAQQNQMSNNAFNPNANASNNNAYNPSAPNF